MTGLYRDAAKTATFLGRWVRKKLKESGASGSVLGLSGGVDSAALAALLRGVCGKDEELALYINQIKEFLGIENDAAVRSLTILAGHAVDRKSVV